MTIIFFPGIGASKKLVKYDYVDNKQVSNNFIKQLGKIDDVYIVERDYVNIHYYQTTDIKGFKKMYKPINKLLLEDLDLLSYTKKIYNNVKHLKKPYVLMASSHGIYYALAFAHLYPPHVKHIISLDGSWITKKLCKTRLDKFKKQKRKSIGSQKELDQIVNEIKNNKDNNNAI